MFSDTISPTQSSASFLSTSLVYFRKEIHKGVGHNWGDSSLQKQFCHQRNCSWNNIYETTKQQASVGITDKAQHNTQSFLIALLWGMWTRFTLLHHEYTVLHCCSSTPTDKRMPQRCWGTFVYKQKSRDKLQSWLPSMPLISNHWPFKKKKKNLFSHLKPLRISVHSNDHEVKANIWNNITRWLCRFTYMVNSPSE